MQTVIPMPDGSGMRLTTAKYFTPAGRDIQAKGIEPDFAVAGDPLAGYDQGRREWLREADLDRHLRNNEEEDRPVPPVEDEASPPSEGDQPQSKQQEQDPQLDMALRILKAWPAFVQSAVDKSE